MPVTRGDEDIPRATPPNSQVSRTSPSTGGATGPTLGYPQPPRQAPYVPSPNYQLGGDFYYHPSMGIGTNTGGWGDRRSGGTRRHAGQDIRMPMNTMLVATTSGTISHYANSSAGTVIYLKGDDGNKYSYFHLNTRLVPDGARVQAGQPIARSGDSGNSTAPHLHFEVWWQGTKVDPMPFLAGASTTGRGAPPIDPRIRKEEIFFPNDQAQGNVPLPDFYDQEGFYDQIGDILNRYPDGPQVLPDTTYGAWFDQLQNYQQGLADRGLAEEPRKTKAKQLLHRSLRSMAEATRQNGYRSSFPSSGGSLPGGTERPPPDTSVRRS